MEFIFFLAGMVLLDGAVVCGASLKPEVELEEEVYSYEPANNGAGPLVSWIDVFGAGGHQCIRERIGDVVRRKAAE